MKNALAVVAGLIIGSMVNMGLIILGSEIIPPPAGVDVTNMENIQASMHLFEPHHFIFPFLAHALGTLVGAFIAALIASSHPTKWALGIGGLFMIGGIANAFMLPAPLWFIMLDLIGAYIPMAWMGGNWAVKKASLQSHDN